MAYSLAGERVGQLAVTRGIDPGGGFLHGGVGNRPNLALDLLEPLQPWTDLWVWQLVRPGYRAYAPEWLEGHAHHSFARLLRQLKPLIETMT